MRLDPLRYPLVTNRAIYMARTLFGAGVSKRLITLTLTQPQSYP